MLVEAPLEILVTVEHFLSFLFIGASGQDSWKAQSRVKLVLRVESFSSLAKLGRQRLITKLLLVLEQRHYATDLWRVKLS